MSDAKQYEAMAASEFDLRREVVSLRAINKDLLDACERLMRHHYCQAGGWDGEGVCPNRCDDCDMARAAIRRAKEGK